MTIKFLYHNLDYEHSSQERVGHGNQDLLIPSKENASKPLEQNLTIVRISMPTTSSTCLPELWRKYKLPLFFIGQEYHGHYDAVMNEIDRQPPVLESFTIEKADTTKPTNGEINVYGQQRAKEKALERFAQNVGNMISYRDNRLVSCYRNAAEQGGLDSTLIFNETFLTSLNLARIFEDSDASVKGRFVRDALYLSVAMGGECDDILTRDQQEWNEIITCNMEFPDELEIACGLDKSRLDWATHAICLLSDLLDISGQRKRSQQGRLSSEDLTPRESLTLLCNMFEVPILSPNHMRTCSLDEIQETVSSSRLFVKDRLMSDIKERIPVLVNYLPIGLPDCAKTLEPELLNIFTAWEWTSMQMFISQICTELPSLEYPQHNLPLLLVWSAQCTGRTQRELYAWAKSGHGTTEYHRLVETLVHPMGLAETALILGAVKTFVQIYGHESQPQEIAPLSQLIDVLKGMRERASPTLDHMSKAFDLVLREHVNGTEYQIIHQILALDPTPTYRQCELEQLYWKCRCTGPRSHYDAVKAMNTSIYRGSLTFRAIPTQDKRAWVEEENNSR